MVVGDYEWLSVFWGGYRCFLVVMGGSGVVMGDTSDYKWVQVVMGCYGVVLVGFGWLQVVTSGYG